MPNKKLNYNIFESERIINEVIDDAVNNELKRLSKKDKEYIKNNEDYGEFHFSYGLYLRNKYIHGNKKLKGMFIMYDDLSEEIFDKIREKLINNEKIK